MNKLEKLLYGTVAAVGLVSGLSNYSYAVTPQQKEQDHEYIERQRIAQSLDMSSHNFISPSERNKDDGKKLKDPSDNEQRANATGFYNAAIDQLQHGLIEHLRDGTTRKTSGLEFAMNNMGNALNIWPSKNKPKKWLQDRITIYKARVKEVVAINGYNQEATELIKQLKIDFKANDKEVDNWYKIIQGNPNYARSN